MKYRLLFQFEAVTEVIQLVTANKKEKAAQLVKTYVISDRMADVILHRILPALKLNESARSRGLLIVGNYGTGKSHLMSMLTAVAEHADLLDQVRHPGVRSELAAVAGKFMVSRQETTALDIPLRELVFNQLEASLRQMGVEHHFPGSQEPVTNKQALANMMARFTEVHPGKGLLVALDELLDFLRQKNEKEMIMDLNFLREVGEVCENYPLRFMAGIQEALFDNPRFQFVASSIQRVKSRFDEASIVREDIAYVVSHRLLAKTPEQKKIIRSHLEKFTPLYAEMAERLDDFEELFPVHPAYLEVFERVTIGERRELLKAISEEMTKLLDQDLPLDEPGLITFDSYWRMIREDNAFRAIPDVREVLDKAEVLSEKVRRAPETRDYQAAALRIIDGLALNRLAVSDIYTSIGMTPAEIRDQLCILLPLPERDADFLLATIETILKAVLKAVNGQFISHNPGNDQYYLDLKKDIDYDALIQAKAEGLDHSTLDRYYFDLITHALEINTVSAYVPGFRIWESEIPWTTHGITRRGYIFLGAANERSTAHPERDFYIHFLGVYGNGLPSPRRQNDEVFFKLSVEEKSFSAALKLYAGASEMSAISSGSNKDQYEMKAQQARRVLMQWLRENLLRCFHIYHADQEWTAAEAAAKFRLVTRDQTIRDQVFRLSGAILAPAFQEKFPHYPAFTGIELTSSTLPSAAEAALKALSGGANTRMAQIVLEGLCLGHMENGRMIWKIEESPYASHFLGMVTSLEPGKVINRADLVSGEPGAERDVAFQLELELLAVVLVALARQGGLTLTVQGIQLAASDIGEGARLDLQQLVRFTSISRPKPLPEQAVRELFSQFNIPPETVADPAALALGIGQLQQNVQNELDQVVRMADSLREGPKFWQEMILPPAEQQQARRELDDYRRFLSGLQPYTTPGRLANLAVGVGEIRAAVKARAAVRDVRHIFEVLRELEVGRDYLVLAQPLLPAADPWQMELKEARRLVIETLADPSRRNGPEVGGLLKARLENVKASYARRYLELHGQYRLDQRQDEEKKLLTGDPRWARMRALSKISLLPSARLERLKGDLGAVTACYHLQLADLQDHVHCPHCGFDPASSASLEKPAAALERTKQEFDGLCRGWVETLLANLRAEVAQQHLAMLAPAEQEVVREFLRAGALPEPLTERFISGVENTLSGLELITIDGAEYLLALTQPGMPCTPEELEKRIREFLQQRLEGKDRRKLRIQINW